MCQVCEGNFPSAESHAALSSAAKQLRHRVIEEQLTADTDDFVAGVVGLDQLRFSNGSGDDSPEWGQPLTAPSTLRHIFGSSFPDRLQLFALACWYDAQESYTTVWSRRLAQLDEWLGSPLKTKENLPSARSGPFTRSIAWQTWGVCGEQGFAHWLARTIIEIAEANPDGAGNTGRLMGRMGLELTTPGKENTQRFRALAAGASATPLFKRGWMFLMFLRRDQGIVRCLLQRELAKVEGGRLAADLWYSEQHFPSQECALPVDQRMLAIGREIFGLGLADEEEVMMAAQAWGHRHGLAPATLDALFFAMD